MMQSVTAPYPASGYPASAFFGAGALGSMAPAGTTAQAAPASPQKQRELLIVVGAFIAAGLLAFHMYNR